MGFLPILDFLFSVLKVPKPFIFTIFSELRPSTIIFKISFKIFCSPSVFPVAKKNLQSYFLFISFIVCIIIFDGKHGSKSRQKVYDGYKGGRKVRTRLNRVVDWDINVQNESEAMKRQLSRLVEYIENLPLTILSIDGLEADDVIAYATNTALKDSKITIMSTDKDFYQLVSDRVQMYSPTKKITYDKELVRKEFGIYPQNMLTCRVIDGDKSDGIPGVRGCLLYTSDAADE